MNLILKEKEPVGNKDLSEKIVENLETTLDLLKEDNFSKKLSKVKGVTIPSNMTDEDIVNAWDILNIPEKEVFDKMLLMVNKKDKMIILKYIAETDLSMKEGFQLGGQNGMVPFQERAIEVKRPEKLLFFNYNFIGSLISLLIGIYLFYLVADTLQGFNETYNLNITITGLFTNFKGTIKFIPIAVLKVITRDAIDVMKYRIQTACTSITGNTVSTMLYSFFESTDSTNCIQNQSIAGIQEVASLSAAQITTSLNMVWRLSAIGTVLVSGAVGNIGRLLLDKPKEPLAIEDGSTGGKRKSRRRGRKSKKTRKSKKGRKGRKSRRKH